MALYNVLELPKHAPKSFRKPFKPHWYGLIACKTEKNAAAAAAAGASFGVFIAVEVANKILGLGLGRDQESHADKKSVIYMGTGSHYSSIALADFFEELISSGNNVNIPPIISTHPDTENRVYRIRKWAQRMGYRTEYSNNPEFKLLQSSIP